jgi:hypothetical protein
MVNMKPATKLVHSALTDYGVDVTKTGSHTLHFDYEGAPHKALILPVGEQVGRIRDQVHAATHSPSVGGNPFLK